MESKYKSAGIWNIVCGLSILVPMLLCVLITGLLAWLGVEAEAGVVGLILVIVSTIFTIAFIPCLIVSIGFILVGRALLKTDKVSDVLQFFLILHIVVKVIIAFLALISFLIPWLVILSFSIVFDFKVLRENSEKLLTF